LKIVKEKFDLEFLLRIIFSRLLKYTANALRPIFLLHHYLWPEKRFQLPHSAAPIIATNKKRNIPRIVWQTNYSDRVTLAVYATYLANRLLAPTFEFRFHDDKEMDQFVRENCKAETADAFFKLQIGAARADLWRILVILQYGGVYLDMDANFAWPPEWSIKKDDDVFFIHDRTGEITNFFLAGAIGNPVFEGLEAGIRRNIEIGTLKSIFEMTGPVAIKKGLEGRPVLIHSFRNVCHQGQFMNARLQYPDRGRVKWTQEQKTKSVLK
jgi:mannosyltransferase OCH1-like enzyme